MSKTIKLLKNNDKKDWDDLEWINEFRDFLKGKNPESIKTTPLSLTEEEAFTVIWYLQEHFSILPDRIEKCDNCNDLYDSYSSGYYTEKGNDKGHHHFCNCCEDLALYDDID